MTAPRLPEPVVARVAALLTRCRFPSAGADVACAVSGGADSLTLLVLACAAGCRVTAIHVDHGLRVGSSLEADVVAAAAQRFGAVMRRERVNLTAGPNLEARARAARYGVLPAGALTGHTADDQAETVLLNLMRGAGADGLAAMGPDCHPLLGLRRAETVALCRDLRLEVVDDPSNHDPAYRRNRVRHELVPLLNDLAARDVVPVLVRQASLLGSEARFLDSLAAGIDATVARELVDAPLVLARRCVRNWLREGHGHPPDAATVERVLAVAHGRVEATEVGGGRRVRRSAGRLVLSGPLPSRR